MGKVVSVLCSKIFDLQRRNPYIPKGNCPDFNIYQKCQQMKIDFCQYIGPPSKNLGHKAVYISFLSLNTYFEIPHTVPSTSCVLYSRVKSWLHIILVTCKKG